MLTGKHLYEIGPWLDTNILKSLPFSTYIYTVYTKQHSCSFLAKFLPPPQKLHVAFCLATMFEVPFGVDSSKTVDMVCVPWVPNAPPELVAQVLVVSTDG